MKLKFIVILALLLQSLWLPQAASPADAAPTYYQNKAIVLMYHDIAYQEIKGKTATITPSRLGTHLKMLKDNGYNVISIEQFADFMLNGGTVPDNAVVLTFDDGYESFYTLAAPILKKYGMTAAGFIIGSSTDYNNVETKHMTWDQMRELKSEGFSFYNHTYNLHDYGEINKAGTRTGPILKQRLYLADEGRYETLTEYNARVLSDLELMESKLKTELGNTYQMLSYPYGEFSTPAKKMAKKAGIKLFFTIDPGINQPGRDTVYRINAGAPTISAAQLLAVLQQYH